MSLGELIGSIKSHPDIASAGMILCHNGVVRNCSRDGRKVSGLRVTVDHTRLAEILEAARRRPGIVDVQVSITEDRNLRVGDDVMFLAVAGDVRENVLTVLADTLEAIKTSVTHKTEFYR